MKIKLTLKQKVKYLFYSLYSATAAVILLVSLFVFASMYEDVDLLALQLDDDSPTTKGIVTGNWYWGVAIDESDYYGISYSYENPENKETFYWASFSKSKLAEGTEVSIVYSADEPSVSKIKGSTNTVLSPMNVTVAFFLLILSLSILYKGVSKQLREFRILRNGVVTKGTLQRIRATGDSHNEDVIFRFQFHFKTVEGKLIKTLVHSFRKEQLTDEKQEILVYHKERPKSIVLVDDFPTFIGKEIRRQAVQLLQEKEKH